ncbi:MAG: PAS domain S-box protein [Spirochaetales bacterium]|nr:PAS domain S-box protein [Spirochaetales bacterium]
MNIFAGFSLFASFECIIIGVYVFSKSTKTKLNIIFLLMCISNGLRAFVEFGYRISESFDTAHFWQTCDIFWPFASLLVFHFVIEFVFENKVSFLLKKILLPVLYGIAVILTGVEILSDAITGLPYQVFWGWTYGPGTVDGALVLSTLFTYLLCFSAIILLIGFLLKNKAYRLRKGGVGLSLFLAFFSFTGFLTELVLPIAGIQLPETSNIATAIGIIPLGYFIWKNKIFEISPIVAVDHIISSMSDSLFLVRNDGLIQFTNEAAVNLLGYSPEEFKQLQILKMLPPGEAQSLRSFFWGKSQNQERMQYIETEFIRKDGTLLSVSLSISPVTIKGNGNTLGTVCIARDISERKQKDALLDDYRHRLEELVRLRTVKLRENYQRYITLFRESPSALIEIDLSQVNDEISSFQKKPSFDIVDFCMEHPLQALRLLRQVKVTQVNKALFQLFNVESKSRFIQDRHRIFRKKSFTILMTILESLFYGDEEIETNGIVYRPDGSERYIMLRLSHLHDDGSRHKRALLSMVDLTPQKRAEEEKAELEEQLRHVQKMEALGTLAGGIAHDFNNLLSGILGYADLIKSDTDPDSSIHQDVDVIDKTAHKAAGLVRQLLNFARKGKQNTVVFDIHMIIDEVMTILKHSIDKRIKIIRRFSGDSIFIAGDPGQIEQVIINLAVNACDAMEKGGDLVFETGIITPASKKRFAYPHLAEAEYVSVTVRDSGEGIPDEIRDRIFEPFFTTKEPGKGTGMGLAVAYGIIANHDGIIEVERNEPSGTLFRLLLPLARSRQQQEMPRAVHEQHHAGEGKILVVDDEDVVCRVLERMLSQQGYNVTVVHDGEEAIKAYSRDHDVIDIVLIDMVMPKMNGRDCFRAMRKMNPDVNAVLITGYLPEGTAYEAITEGMRDVIFKPFSRERLSRVIHTILGE